MLVAKQAIVLNMYSIIYTHKISLNIKGTLKKKKINWHDICLFDFYQFQIID